MIDFKATKHNLIAQSNGLEAHAKASLNAWILTGQADKYQRVMSAARMLRNAANLKRMVDRREYLKDVDASF